MSFILVSFKILYGGELIAGGSPVREKYMEICYSSNVAGGSPTLESYVETRLYWKVRNLKMQLGNILGWI